MTITELPPVVAAPSDAAVIRDLAEKAATREVHTFGDAQRAAVVLRADERLEQVDLEQFDTHPKRKTGHVQLGDGDSLVGYVLRHASDTGTTIWADLDTARVVAVLDDHHASADLAGWAQHRATLTLRETVDWEHWLKYDGKLLSQEQFAEHIEEGVEAVREPDAASILEVAQSFHVRRGVNFNSAKMLTGEIQFGYNEDVTARAGKSGTLEIPQTFTLGLAPFEGSALYEVKARFRFRLNDGHLSLGYRLIRADKTRRAAFDEIVQKILEGSSLAVMAGTPRP